MGVLRLNAPTIADGGKIAIRDAGNARRLGRGRPPGVERRADTGICLTRHSRSHRGRASMHFQFAEIFGIAAALATLYAAHSKTMIPLRWAAIAANALAMVYSAMHGTWPTFALNAILLPTNAWRLHAMLRLIGDLDRAIKSDMSAEWLLPYARPKTFKAGDVMMARGDYATAAF